jgi:hypothetical protein
MLNTAVGRGPKAGVNPVTSYLPIGREKTAL